MLSTLKQLARSLAFLRHPETLAGLAELVSELRLRQQIMRDHPGFVLEKDTIVLGYDTSRLHAEKARVARGSVLSFGDEVTGYGDIALGNDTWVGQYNNLRASQDAAIVIGANCLVSQFCSLVGANHQNRSGCSHHSATFGNRSPRHHDRKRRLVGGRRDGLAGCPYRRRRDPGCGERGDEKRAGGRNLDRRTCQTDRDS